MVCIALPIVLLTIPLSNVGHEELLAFLMEEQFALWPKGSQDKFTQKFLRLRAVFQGVLRVETSQAKVTLTGKASGLEGVAEGEAASFKKLLPPFLPRDKKRVVAMLLVACWKGHLVHLHPIKGLESVQYSFSLGGKMIVVDRADKVEGGSR